MNALTSIHLADFSTSGSTESDVRAYPGLGGLPVRLGHSNATVRYLRHDGVAGYLAGLAFAGEWRLMEYPIEYLSTTSGLPLEECKPVIQLREAIRNYLASPGPSPSPRS